MAESSHVVVAKIRQFSADEERLTASNSRYSETETRVEYIDPLFAALGWDMANSTGLPNRLKDVVREESQQNEAVGKRPDYTFRISAERKFFLEAKRPSVDIKTSKESALQIRSYGWTSGLPLSLLTNFRTLRVYDTRMPISDSDDVDTGLLLEWDYTAYSTEFKKFESLFGREAVALGSIPDYFGSTFTAVPVNKIFLERINRWRLDLAMDLGGRYRQLSLVELNDSVQKIINRLIFIRMCEDRGIEGEEHLRKVAAKKDIVEIRRLFSELDSRYNTGLFDTVTDPFSAKLVLDSEVFLKIVEQLYFPKAPYSFGVLDADFLGQVYELFLTQRLAKDSRGLLLLAQKPEYEDREIVTTPQSLVNELARRTITGYFNQKETDGPSTYVGLKEIRLIDSAVGSGRFLLRSMDELVDKAIEILRREGDTRMVYERSRGDFRLIFTEKTELLEKCLFGIDIDYNAVEVTRFSLLIKLLEDENGATLPPGNKILPNLDKNIVWGNSVVAADISDRYSPVVEAIHPLDWRTAIQPTEFNIVITNPPYLKTEEIKKSPIEYKYFREKYKTPFKQFDKYFVFIEQAIRKTRQNGWIGMVVPNKWLTIEAGSNLRELLASEGLIAEIVNFGNELMFEGKATYVCLLILRKTPGESFYYRDIHRIDDYLERPTEKGKRLPMALIRKYSRGAWVLPGTDAEEQLLYALNTKCVPMNTVADIFNGVQTSAEAIYAIDRWKEFSDGLIQFTKEGKLWEIEKAATRPYLTNSDLVYSYAEIQGDCRIIFPYEFNEENEAVLLMPEKLAATFPKLWHYLVAHQARLECRNVAPPIINHVGFYRYGRHQSLSIGFSAPKIVLSVNQLGDKYSMDYEGVGIASGGTAGEIAISNPKLGYSLEFLLGLLNQKAIEFFCRKRGSPFRGGYYSRGTAVIEKVPVPALDFNDPKQMTLHESITNSVRALIANRKAGVSATGRTKESLDQEFAAMQSDLGKLFDEVLDIDGALNRVVLPGESNPITIEMSVPSDIALDLRIHPASKTKDLDALVPVYDLKAAAGHFGAGESVAEEDRIDIGARRFDSDMFAARVVGHSMEPKIPNNSLCLFHANPTGSLEGRIVLAQYRGLADPETGGQFTVKRFRRIQRANPDGTMERVKIWLEPLNSVYPVIDINPSDSESVKVVAEFVEVLSVDGSDQT